MSAGAVGAAPVLRRDKMLNPSKNTREHGLAQERRIVDALRRAPQTEFQLAEMLGITRNATTIYMSRMRKQKRIRIVDYIKSTSGRPLPIFGVGSAPDLEYVPLRPRNKAKQPDRVEAMRKAILLLLRAPHTAAEMAEKLHRSQSVINTYVRDLREEKQVRISGWKQTGSRNGWAPVYRLGKAKDRPRPPPETAKERHLRERQDPERYERELAQRRRRHKIRTLRAKPQGVFAALGV